MKAPLISVVIPVYNAEKYLPAAIDSVLVQTFKEWELILIDDGSTDQSGSICDQYGLQHRDYVRVVHQRNRGVSSARNAGINAARGEYIAFIDADDYISADYLQILWLRQRETNADLVIIGKQTVDSNYIDNSRDCYDDEVYHAESFPALMHKPADLCVSVWAKLLRRSLIEKYSLEFALDLSLGEDALFISCYISTCDRIAITSRVGYYCRRGHDSLSCRWECFGPENIIRRIDLFQQFADKYVLHSRFCDELLIHWYHITLRNIIDRRYSYPNTKENLIYLCADKGFQGYIAQIDLQKLSMLERLYVYILRRITPPPSTYTALLLFVVSRITQKIGYLRSKCQFKLCKNVTTSCLSMRVLGL